MSKPHIVYVPGLDEVVTSVLIATSSEDGGFLKRSGDTISLGESFYRTNLVINKGGLFSGSQSYDVSIKSPVEGRIHGTWRVWGYSSRRYEPKKRLQKVTSYGSALDWGCAIAVEVPNFQEVRVGSTYSPLLRSILDNEDKIDQKFRSNEGYISDWQAFLREEISYMERLVCPCLLKE